ncbi:secreted RxLR effector protein 161-like [Vicia villosa]|uniref:secreted RxLR effector protein 161-like n=1 Tax=Vicia villosa TaxID=3911 RepID=UPI00273BB3A3|nr:secreted RxLR effector protein 161-like [Vicia villosa]
MDKANPLSSPMMGRTLNIEKDPFRPKESNEEDLGSEVSYLSAIGALIYIVNYTRPDIDFAVNLLARFSSCPTKIHWKGIKHIFRYLRGTTDLGLFYSNNTKPVLLGYADAGYLSDPHNAKLQTGYIFTSGNTAISWRSQKQTLVATSSNHAELIALHEASREFRWLRPVTRHIQGASGLPIDNNPTILYEDKAACVTQMKEDLFTKTLPTSVFKKHVQNIGMRHIRDL